MVSTKKPCRDPSLPLSVFIFIVACHLCGLPDLLRVFVGEITDGGRSNHAVALSPRLQKLGACQVRERSNALKWTRYPEIKKLVLCRFGPCINVHDSANGKFQLGNGSTTRCQDLAQRRVQLFK